MYECVCPRCKNTIYDEDALLCHFCGESLGRPSGGGLGMMRSMPWKWVFVIVAVFIILSFLLTLG